MTAEARFWHSFHHFVWNETEDLFDGCGPAMGHLDYSVAGQFGLAGNHLGGFGNERFPIDRKHRLVVTDKRGGNILDPGPFQKAHHQ